MCKTPRFVSSAGRAANNQRRRDENAAGQRATPSVILSERPRNSNIWEVQFKRRVIGRIQFRIEYERRGDRENESETLSPAGFPSSPTAFVSLCGIRAGGRLGDQSRRYSAAGVAAGRLEHGSLRHFAKREIETLQRLSLRAVAPGRTR